MYYPVFQSDGCMASYIQQCGKYIDYQDRKTINIITYNCLQACTYKYIMMYRIWIIYYHFIITGLQSFLLRNEKQITAGIERQIQLLDHKKSKIFVFAIQILTTSRLVTIMVDALCSSQNINGHGWLANFVLWLKFISSIQLYSCSMTLYQWLIHDYACC